MVGRPATAAAKNGRRGGGGGPHSQSSTSSAPNSAGPGRPRTASGAAAAGRAQARVGKEKPKRPAGSTWHLAAGRLEPPGTVGSRLFSYTCSRTLVVARLFSHTCPTRAASLPGPSLRARSPSRAQTSRPLAAGRVTGDPADTGGEERREGRHAGGGGPEGPAAGPAVGPAAVRHPRQPRPEARPEHAARPQRRVKQPPPLGGRCAGSVQYRRRCSRLARQNDTYSFDTGKIDS